MKSIFNQLNCFSSPEEEEEKEIYLEIEKWREWREAVVKLWGEGGPELSYIWRARTSFDEYKLFNNLNQEDGENQKEKGIYVQLKIATICATAGGGFCAAELDELGFHDQIDPVFQKDQDLLPNIKTFIPDGWEDKLLPYEYQNSKNISVKEIFQRVQGYFSYVNDCLNYIYATETGKKLLKALEKKTLTFIVPGKKNCYSGSGMGGKLKEVSKCLLTSIVPNIREKRILLAALGKFNKDNSDKEFDESNDEFASLIKGVNEMPGYSLNKRIFKKGYLKDKKKTVKSRDIKNLFDNGTNAALKAFDNRGSQDEISYQNFIINAICILLYDYSNASVPTNNVAPRSIIMFSAITHKNLTPKMHQNKNIIGNRPPAIGLAHELIHAYFTAYGLQPGLESAGAFSNILSELICVGLGPWDKDTMQEKEDGIWVCNPQEFSENKIREEWKKAVFKSYNYKFSEKDTLNNRDYTQKREQYHIPAQEKLERLRQRTESENREGVQIIIENK